MNRAGELLTETMFRPRRSLFEQHRHVAVGKFERGLDALGKSLPRFGADLNAIDHRFDIVSLISPELERIFTGRFQRFAQVDDRSVNTSANEPLSLHRFERVAVKSLLPTNDRRAEHRPSTGILIDE